MVIESPVDATKTRAWAELTQVYTDMHKKGIDLRRWFADEPNRVCALSFDAGDLRIDLS